MPCHLPDANSLVNSQNLFIFVLTMCKEKSKVCSAFGPSEEEGYLNILGGGWVVVHLVITSAIWPWFVKSQMVKVRAKELDKNTL